MTFISFVINDNFFLHQRKSIAWLSSTCTIWAASPPHATEHFRFREHPGASLRPSTVRIDSIEWLATTQKLVISGQFQTSQSQWPSPDPQATELCPKTTCWHASKPNSETIEAKAVTVAVTLVTMFMTFMTMLMTQLFLTNKIASSHAPMLQVSTPPLQEVQELRPQGLKRKILFSNKNSESKPKDPNGLCRTPLGQEYLPVASTLPVEISFLSPNLVGQMRPEHFCKATFQQPAGIRQWKEGSTGKLPKPCSRIDLPQGGRSSHPFHLEGKVHKKW